MSPAASVPSMSHVRVCPHLLPGLLAFFILALREVVMRVRDDARNSGLGSTVSRCCA